MVDAAFKGCLKRGADVGAWRMRLASCGWLRAVGCM
jgi:hypothetical protein